MSTTQKEYEEAVVVVCSMSAHPELKNWAPLMEALAIIRNTRVVVVPEHIPPTAEVSAASADEMLLASHIAGLKEAAKMADEHMTLPAKMGHVTTWPIAKRIAERIRARITELEGKV